jgi:4-hydroxy-2-oxoheptanedioate aldolase
VDVLMFANAARKLRGQFAGATAAAAPTKPSAGY